MPEKPPTLKMIAASAGVHVSTASRALDPARRHLIADDVIRHVEDVARGLGYRRNVGAAALRTGRSRLIGVILPDLANPVFAPILQGVEEAIARDGYSAIVANAGGSTARAVAAAESLIARRVEGLVSASAELDDPVVSLCADARMPLVLVNRAEDRLRTDTVVSDDRKGLKLAVDHLFGLGHRRIGHIAGPANISTGLWRRDGFAQAMSARGLEASAVVEAVSYSRDAGLTAARALLALAPVTAIAVANDLVALGVCRALADKGLSCPRDVSVVGYNDMPLVDLVEPPLTTIRIRSYEVGLRAGTRVLAAIRSPGAAPVSDTVQPELVVRRSSAPPRGAADAPGSY